MSSADKTFQEAFRAFNAQQHGEAERLFRKVLKGHPSHIGALNLLTIVLMKMQRFSEAEPFIARAVKLDQTSDISFYNYGIILKALNRPPLALEQFSAALRLNSKVPETWNNRGAIYNTLAQYEKALADFDQAILVSPNYADALANKANSLTKLKRYDEAFAAYDKALSLKPDLAEAWLGRGNALHELKRHDEAVAAYGRALSLKPDLVEAWLSRGNLFVDLKRYDEALADYDRALSLKSDAEEAWLGRGSALFNLRRYGEALAACDKALSLKSELAAAWLGRGNVLFELKRHDESSAAYDKARALDPDFAEAWLGRGNVFSALEQYDEAFAAYDRALALKPDFAEVWLSRGNGFVVLKRYDEAFAAYDEALSLQPDAAGAWLGRGNAFVNLRHYDEAFAAYDAALSLKPDLAEAWISRGDTLFGLKRCGEAIAAYDKGLSLKPHLSEGWLGRGNACLELGQHDEAFASYGKAISLTPDMAEAWLGRGNVFMELRRFEEAVSAYDKALLLKPDLLAAEGARIHCKMLLCDWRNFEAESDHLVQSVRNGKTTTSPFIFLGIAASAKDQLDCARSWTEKHFPPPQGACRRGEFHEGNKIRIGYVSSDFCQHAVATLIAGVFECHDRSRFDVLGISAGPSDNSEIRRRLENSFDQFIDATALGADELERRIREEGIDILIDMNGHNKGSRTEVFSRRPAPIQVNYLGYPGTMGAGFIDYIIADPVLIPEGQQSSYLEKIVYLPDSYMPHTDACRPISDHSFVRAEFGLPEKGVIFCCFNNAYKLNPGRFRSRMRLLRAVEGSVLWLSVNHPTARSHLRAEASVAGIDPGRLVFADQLPSYADHLARHRLADLFLDTLPYNAHTTASDALWAGLPVLTQIGETFAGRVAASLLTAIGLPELIARSEAEFEGTAIELATSPSALAAIKARLAQNRSTMPLFNTPLYTRHLECAYATMYERQQNGLGPEHITVPQ
jgi:predicted O-linked N-acetylglucosamine transferase (SPINDLY family)